MKFGVALSYFRIIFYLSMAVLTAKSMAVETVDQLLEQWVKLEQNEQALNQHWQLEKQHLSTRLNIIDAEEKNLKKIIDITKIRDDEVAKKRQKLLSQQLILEQQLAQWQQHFAQLEHQFEQLWLVTPPYLKTELQPLYEKLKQDTPSVSVRYQNLASLLKKVRRADNLIHYHRGAILLNGEQLIVEQLFLGNALGWFVAQDNSISGIGTSTSTGWRWLQDDSAKESIRQAIVRYQQQTPGNLISLPLKLDAAP